MVGLICSVIFFMVIILILLFVVKFLLVIIGQELLFMWMWLWLFISGVFSVRWWFISCCLCWLSWVLVGCCVLMCLCSYFDYSYVVSRVRMVNSVFCYFQFSGRSQVRVLVIMLVMLFYSRYLLLFSILVVSSSLLRFSQNRWGCVRIMLIMIFFDCQCFF